MQKAFDTLYKESIQWIIYNKYKYIRIDGFCFEDIIIWRRDYAFYKNTRKNIGSILALKILTGINMREIFEKNG